MLFRALRQSNNGTATPMQPTAAATQITNNSKATRAANGVISHTGNGFSHTGKLVAHRQRLSGRTPWRQPWSPGRHVAAILLVLFAVLTGQGRLFVPVHK